MLEVIILAAGQGSRMQSSIPKVLHPLAGRPLVAHVLQTARRLNADRIHVVVGYGAEAVQSAVAAADVQCHLQAEQLGTGHAVKQAISSCQPTSTVLVLFGDVPLITEEALRSVLAKAETGVAMLSATLPNPAGYGRVVRSAADEFVAVVEERDATPEQRALQEINTGVLAANAERLAGWLDRVGNQNAQAEYYLPDVLGLASEDGMRVEVVLSEDDFDTQGVNTPQQLEQLERLHQVALADQLMNGGVRVSDRSRLDIRGRLQCGQDVRIDINVVIEGDVVLGDGVSIGANCILRDTQVGDGTQILPFQLFGWRIGGRRGGDRPLCPPAPGSVIDENAKVGNFVEVKNAHIGKGAKANHLAYLGDADIGH